MSDYKQYTFRLAFRDGGNLEHKVMAKNYHSAIVVAATESAIYASRVTSITYVSETSWQEALQAEANKPFFQALGEAMEKADQK